MDLLKKRFEAIDLFQMEFEPRLIHFVILHRRSGAWLRQPPAHLRAGLSGRGLARQRDQGESRLPLSLSLSL